MNKQRKTTLFFLALSFCLGLLLWQQIRPVAASGKTGALPANQWGAVRNGTAGIGAFEIEPDTDGDGVPDVTDNCPTTYNPEKIAFASNRNGNDLEIYVMNAIGSAPVNVSNNPAIDGEVVISPDGTKIAFTSNRDGNFEIYVMNIDGSNPTRLTNNPAFDGTPAFSPDGTKIAFVSTRDGKAEIYLMNADGSGQTRVTNDEFTNSQPVFSPDSTKIVYLSGATIARINTDGTNRVSLTPVLFNLQAPAISPDGARIAFSAGTGNTIGVDIMVMNADGSNRINLTSTDGPSEIKPGFSPDGSKIVYLRQQDIYTMNADGSNQTALLADNPFGNNSVSWGPQADGNGNGIGDVCEMPADSTPPVITPSVTGTLGNNDWYVSNVQVSWNVIDEESTVSGQTGCDTQTVSVDTDGVTFTCEATSAGGTSSISVTVKRDATAPTLNPTVSPNPVFLNGLATATPNASDARSGIASSSCAAPNTTTVGSKSINCTATDNAGNTATASANYRVIYNFSGFLQPVNNAPVVNSAAAGQSIPVKFSLSGNQGLNIFETGFPRSLSMVCGGGATNSIEETVNPGASSLSYDATTDRYNYVWKTEKAWKGTCRKLAVKFNDGSTYEALFQFK